METTKIDQQIDDIMSKFLAQTLTDDDYRLMKAKLLSRKQELNERRESLAKADEEIYLSNENRP